jgi:hypothetical protein
VEVFNSKIAPADLEAMLKGTKADVSIGFFFDKDDSPGTLEDGPFKGEAFDYVQRSMFHDHLAVAIDNGRCPSPFCGLGADELPFSASDPFSGFQNFGECISKVKNENKGLSDEGAQKICGSLKAKHEKSKKDGDDMGKLIKQLAKQIMDEMEELKGMKDSKQEAFPVWWRGIDWKEPEYTTIFDNLSEEVRQVITDAGLCPHCDKKKEEPPAEEKKGYSPKEEGEKEKEDPKGDPKTPEGELTEEEKKYLEEKRLKEEEEKKKKDSDALPTAPATPLPKVPGLDPRKVLERAEKYLK